MRISYLRHTWQTQKQGSHSTEVVSSLGLLAAPEITQWVPQWTQPLLVPFTMKVLFFSNWHVSQIRLLVETAQLHILPKSTLIGSRACSNCNCTCIVVLQFIITRHVCTINKACRIHQACSLIKTAVTAHALCVLQFMTENYKACFHKAKPCRKL